jgi:Kef-type K+ transport system membrane component KefB
VNSQDFVKFALQITTMLACALFFGQLMRKVKQPRVVGEMVGGIVLGPTLFGVLAPDLYTWLFRSPAFAIILSDIAPSSQAAPTSLPIIIVMVVIFFVVVLGVGRWLGPRTLQWARD